ncbi:MAG: glycosyltransferase family 2 protein [Patescibacteria group bacterium]|jgi:glycosyltransferase involved in cell wall biosynthesis
MPETSEKSLSIIIPAYNEAETIGKTIEGLKNSINNLSLNFEIIVVNDASTDNTSDILKNITDIKIIVQPYNKGYGAALKTGAKTAQSEWLIFFDADGQHRPEYIKEMVPFMDNFDLISGERVGYQGPWLRQPGKKLIHWLAIYLLNKKISDFNCGLRLIKKNEFLRFSHILPNGFSCSTTSLFAFIKEGLNVKFIPIQIDKRGGGKSMVKPREFFTYLILVMRLTMLFSPLRFFLPIGLLLGLTGLIMLIAGLIMNNIAKSTILVVLSAIIIFFFGLLADQIAALRREIYR